MGNKETWNSGMMCHERLTRKKVSILYLLIPSVMMIAGFSVAFAQLSEQVVVTATVPGTPIEQDTEVRFLGLAYPGSDVTIRQNGSILATVPAGPDARFDVTIDIDPGIYTFTLFGEDVQGRVGRESNFTLSLTEGTLTSISGIFLAPTIEVNALSTEFGDTVTVLGTTAPNSDVTIFVSSSLTGSGAFTTTSDTTFEVDADADGLWAQSFLADDLGIGTHAIRSKSASPEAEISEFSSTVTVEVTAGDPNPCASASPGDINCDGFVNLVDFSILLFYWQQANPANARADVNSDGFVDITDFSIMLFHWTG